jgi:hypothetical protein
VVRGTILVRDTVATIVGVGGTVYTTLRDVANVLTFGNVYSKGNLFSAVKSLVADAVVPEYGMFGGGELGNDSRPGTRLDLESRGFGVLSPRHQSQ